MLAAEAGRSSQVHRAFYDGVAARKPTGSTTTAGSDFGSAHARHDIGTPATSVTGPTEVSANFMSQLAGALLPAISQAMQSVRGRGIDSEPVPAPIVQGAANAASEPIPSKLIETLARTQTETQVFTDLSNHRPNDLPPEPPDDTGSRGSEEPPEKGAGGEDKEPSRKDKGRLPPNGGGGPGDGGAGDPEITGDQGEAKQSVKVATKNDDQHTQ